MKDLFSNQAELYASFRPTYPHELYEFILGHVKEQDTAWDCGTGNGQVARYLAGRFARVFATDISRKQLDHAHKTENIFYSVEPAERTSFRDSQFDLVTVAQALHWFDLDKFRQEVKRVTKPGGILAAWTYNLLTLSPEIDAHIRHFYSHTVGPYWDEARTLVEDGYSTLTFPFREIPAPPFTIAVNWHLADLEGYLNTWSATRLYIEKNDHNPVPDLIRHLTPLWHGSLPASFPIALRLFEIVK